MISSFEHLKHGIVLVGLTPTFGDGQSSWASHLERPRLELSLAPRAGRTNGRQERPSAPDDQAGPPGTASAGRQGPRQGQSSLVNRRLHPLGMGAWRIAKWLVLTLTLLIAGTAPLLSRQEAAAKVQSFVSPTGIAIADNRVAEPYPSTIAVSGFTTNVTHVAVTLARFSHTASSDVDVLLVGPGGQSAMIMSDVGGQNLVTLATITLDDRAANPLPEGFPLSTGTFRPTNIQEVADVFPPPAPPSPSSGSALAVFNGTNPNGLWRLFVVDRGAGDSGSIEGWSLLITSANETPRAHLDSFTVKPGKNLNVRVPGVLANDGDSDGDPLTADLARQPRKGRVVLRADGSFTYTPDKDASGVDSFTYRARDSGGLTDTATVRIEIKERTG